MKRPVNPQIKLNNEAVEDMARKMEIGSDNTLGPTISAQTAVHNPVTNPLAYVNQNPYIQG